MKKLSTLTLAGAALLGIASVAPVHAANMGDSSPESTTVESLPAFATCEAAFKKLDGATLKYGNMSTSSIPKIASTAEAAIRTAFYADSSCANYFLSSTRKHYVEFSVESKTGIETDTKTAEFFIAVHEYDSATDSSISYYTAPITISIVEDTDSAKSATASAFISAVKAVKSVELKGDELTNFLTYFSYNFSYNPFRLPAYADILNKYKADGITISSYAYDYGGMGDENTAYLSNAVDTYIGDVYYGPAAAAIHYTYGFATDELTGISIDFKGDDADPAATFTVTPVYEDTASSVIRDEEEFIAAYNFSLKLGDTVFSSFPNGLTVSIPVPDELAGADNIYARYLNADGTVTESDIPVDVWSYGVMSASSTTNTYADFTVKHFSPYILVRTDDPIVISAAEDTPAEDLGPDAPKGGYAASSDTIASTASSLATVVAASVVLFAGAIVYRKSKRA